MFWHGEKLYKPADETSVHDGTYDVGLYGLCKSEYLVRDFDM